MSRRRRVLATALVLALVGIVAACGDDDGPSAGGDGGGPDEVVLVTYDSFALPEEAAAAFEERTGTRIRVVAAGDAGEVLTQALLSAGAPEGDVLFGVDNTLATQVVREDLLEPFTPDGIDEVPEDLRLPGRLGELLTPVDRGDVCINVDAGWFAEHRLDPPTTMDDLVDPTYRDLLVVESPVTSSPGMAFLIGTVAHAGEDGWVRYWEQLRDNGVRVRPSWDDAWSTDYTVSGGDRPLVVSYASSPPVEVVYGEGEVTEPASTIMEAGCVSQIEYAGVLRGAEHPQAARELVEFMLGPAWQGELPLSNFVFPAVEDTPLPEEFQRWAVVPEDPLSVDAATIGEDRDAWIEQWRTVME